MKKKIESSYVVSYMEVDPYTGHIDDEGEICITTSNEVAESIVAALLDYDTRSQHGKPHRQYKVKEVQNSKKLDKDNHWWSW